MCNLNLALGSNPLINQHQMTCEEAVIVKFRAAHLCGSGSYPCAFCPLIGAGFDFASS
jgi:hypothetical protein